MGDPLPAGAAATHHQRAEAAPPAGEPGPAAPGGRRGSPLDRRGDAGRARPPGREPAGGPAPAARQLPPRVPARLEREDLLPPAPARPSSAGAGERAPGNAPRRRRRPRAAQAAPPRTDRGQPLLPRGGRAEPRGRRRAPGRPRRLSAREGSGGLRRAGDGTSDPGRAHRPPAGGRPGPPPDRLGRRHRRPGRGARGGRRTSRGRPGRWASPASSPPSSCTRRAWSRTRSTPSSTPSPTRWPTTACSTSDDAPSMPGSWRRSKRSIPIASPSTSSGSRITPSGARPGKRRSPTFGRPALALRDARPTGRRWRGSNKRWRPYRGSRRRERRRNNRSIFGSNFDTRNTRPAELGSFSIISARRSAWPRRSGINAAWGGSGPSWASTSW